MVGAVAPWFGIGFCLGFQSCLSTFCFGYYEGLFRKQALIQWSPCVFAELLWPELPCSASPTQTHLLELISLQLLQVSFVESLSITWRRAHYLALMASQATPELSDSGQPAFIISPCPEEWAGVGWVLAAHGQAQPGGSAPLTSRLPLGSTKHRCQRASGHTRP